MVKIVFVKVVDPISYFSDNLYFEEDIKEMKGVVIQLAGILIKENDELLVISETIMPQDNEEILHLLQVSPPAYRHPTVISKKDIIFRKDFEVKEE